MVKTKGEATCLLCPAGKECPSADFQHLCPEGTYSELGLGYCKGCPAGCQPLFKKGFTKYN